ncbi:hypothetical protein KA478_04050, partial [Patescibacteria group bacterium]|nr:hypothetical protein [Patescibacteria group bacterium]
FPITVSPYDTTSSDVPTSFASINDITNHSLTYLITRGDNETFCFDGVIEISLSNTHVNFLPSLFVIVIHIVLELHFFIVVPKLDTTPIFDVLRNVSDDFTVELENDVDAFTVVTVGVVTGLVTVGVCHSADGLTVVTNTTGFSGTGGNATNGLLVFCVIFLLMTLLVEVVRVALGISQFASINAIGSTVLAKSDSLHNPFSTIV